MGHEVRTADMAVIGGGIAGAGMAAMASAEARIVLLEAEERPGFHSTGRSVATFLRFYGNAVIRALTAASGDYLATPPEEVAGRSLLSARGLLMTADENDIPALDELLRESAALSEVPAREALSLIPVLRPEKVLRAAFEDAQDIDVDGLHQGWLKLLRRQGGEVVCNARANRLGRNDGVWRIETEAGVVEAPVVVNAAGAWADEVAAMAGLAPIGLVPMRRSIAVLPPPEGHVVDRWPLFSDAGVSWYCKPETGCLFVSPADEDPVAPQDIHPDDMVLAEGLHRFEQATTMTVSRLERSWAGLRTFVPDRTPVVGFDPAAEGFLWLAGQGGYGIQTSPAMSRLAAALGLRRDPPADIAPDIVSALSPSRFR